MIGLFNSVFHLVVNSFLVFFVIALCVEFLLGAFGINNRRMRSLCRLLPFLKLPLDAFVYLISGRFIFYNFNPFGCQTYLREIVGNYFYHVATPTLVLILTLFFLITFFKVTNVIKQSVKGHRHLKSLLETAHPTNRAITNQALAHALQNGKCEVLISPSITSPCVTWKKTILFPEKLLKVVSQNEYEAILSHELNHVQWKDPLVMFGVELVSALFWWIPTRFLLNRLALEQEMACDLESRRYNIQGDELATALIKVIQQQDVKHNYVAMSYATGFTNLKGRFQNMLHYPLYPKTRRLQMALVAFLSLVTTLSFWIC